MDSRKENSTESSTKDSEHKATTSQSSFFKKYMPHFERTQLQQQCQEELMKAREKWFIEHNFDKPFPAENDFEKCRRLKPSPQP